MKISEMYLLRGNKNMGKQKGFSLIELLIVVAIILIIAAIAIPNLLRARIAANESSAASSIRTISTSEVTYQLTYPTVGYATALANLGPATAAGCAAGAAPTSTNACLLDFVLSNATTAALSKSGYFFAATGIATAGLNLGYTASTIPGSQNQSGVRGFCSNEDGVVRYITVAATQVATTAACAAYTSLQ
jgi:type IV pilus assembly protein PilA